MTTSDLPVIISNNFPTLKYTKGPTTKTVEIPNNHQFITVVLPMGLYAELINDHNKDILHYHRGQFLKGQKEGLPFNSKEIKRQLINGNDYILFNEDREIINNKLGKHRLCITETDYNAEVTRDAHKKPSNFYIDPKSISNLPVEQFPTIPLVKPKPNGFSFNLSNPIKSSPIFVPPVFSTPITFDPALVGNSNKIEPIILPPTVFNPALLVSSSKTSSSDTEDNLSVIDFDDDDNSD